METQVIRQDRPAVDRSPGKVYRMWEDEFYALPGPVKAAMRAYALDVWYEGERACFLSTQKGESYFEFYLKELQTVAQ